ATQTALDENLGPRPARVTVVKYGPEIFAEAAIKWVIATDKPLTATTNSYFQEMIGIASCARCRVGIPSRAGVRAGIIRLFKKNLLQLREYLNV
ncbi:hypothetical protein C8R44DRAFT_592819, partial [Mycena epipterygia]